MTGTGVITGLIGPGEQVTALALIEVTRVEIDLLAQTITYFYGDTKSVCVQLDDISAITATVVEGVSVDVTVTNA